MCYVAWCLQNEKGGSTTHVVSTPLRVCRSRGPLHGRRRNAARRGFERLDLCDEHPRLKRCETPGYYPALLHPVGSPRVPCDEHPRLKQCATPGYYPALLHPVGSPRVPFAGIHVQGPCHIILAARPHHSRPECGSTIVCGGGELSAIADESLLCVPALARPSFAASGSGWHDKGPGVGMRHLAAQLGVGCPTDQPIPPSPILAVTE